MAFVTDKDGSKYRVLTVYDKKNYVIGTSHADMHGSSLVQQCRDLLCVCTLYPTMGVSRRPLKVTFKEPDIAE